MDYPEPIGFYTISDDEPLLFHILNVGEGLMVLIVFPDETTMLFDCNVTSENEETILAYLRNNIPFRYDEEIDDSIQWIDIFVNSHRDEDHYKGLVKINLAFKIKYIWDSGETGETTQSADYQYYMALRRRLRQKYGEDAVIIPIPSRDPLRTYGSAEIFCLNSSLDYEYAEGFLSISDYEELIETMVLKEAKITHTNSIVLCIRYGNRSILLPGDSDWKSWRDKIVPNFGDSELLKSNILVSSHHGSRSFFTDETENENIDPENNPETTYIDSIYYIQPSITLIPCGEYEIAHHPNKEAKQIYKKNTAHEQVYTTNDKDSLVGFIDMYGNWTVVPTRFAPKSNIRRNFRINCDYEYQGETHDGNSGKDFPIGCQIHFTISSGFGLFEPYDKVDVWFEVSNGGVDDDHDHQDIYHKRKGERGGKLEFFRDVAYDGTHLLRCRVNNRKKKIDATQIFVVNGRHM